MGLVVLGGSLMALALLVFAGGVAVTLLPRRAGPAPLPGLTPDWAGTPIAVGTSAWTGPVSVLVLVLAMYGFTVLGFELMQSLPLAAAGGGGH